MSTAMALSIHPRLIDLATDFLLSDDRRKRKLLSWVKSILPRVGEDVFDFTACWHDGIVLCSLIEAINPGACPRFGQLKPHHRVQNCRLGLQLAMQYLQVTQLPLCPEEMAIADDKTEVKICHLVQLLKWKYQKQGSKPTVFSIFSVDEPPPCKCQARGTGIRAGIVGRRAKFNILVETATRLDLDIEIRGPNNEYNKEKIVSVDTDSPLPYRKHHVTPQSAAVTEEDGKSKIIDDGAGHSFLRQKTLEEDTGQVVIPFDYQCVGEGRFLVTYIPRNAGLHYITVLSGGVHISGSPFEVKVSDWVSSWNLVPKSRVAPTDMLHSVEGIQADNGVVSKDATTKRQISQVAHMSQQLTRMKRRVLRKVITANGEEIICDVIPALSRQKSQDLLLPEEDTQQTEAVDQADTDTELSCFKYVQSNTFSDGDNDVGDNNHPRVERITQVEQRPCWLEQQNESRTPTITVTHDDQYDSSDVYTVNTRDGTDPSIPDNPTGDLKDSGGPDSLEHAFKDRRVCPSTTNMHLKGYSPRSTAHSSLDRTMTTIKDNDFSLQSYSLSTKASPGDRSSSSGRHSPSLQDTTIAGHVLEDLGSRKKECKAQDYSKTMRSLSADDMCLKRGSNVFNENTGPLAVDILESITSPPEILYSFSNDQNGTAVCQRNTIPCTSIVVLNSPNSKSRESFPDFSLLQISSSKEECGGNGLHEIATHDQTDIMNLDKPTDDGLWSSLHCNTDQRFEVNGSNCCPAGHFTDKLQAANQAGLGNGIYGVIEKVSDIPSVENQTHVTGMAQHQDLIACNAREDAVGKAHFCNDVVSRACNVNCEVKTEHGREIRMASSCDIYDCHYEVDVELPFYKNGNAGHKLTKSWSDPYRDDNLGGKSRTEASPAIIPLDSTVHLNKPELELLCSDSETGYKDMHTNQYKIEILNSDGLNRPYFCFKDDIHCDDKRRRHGIVDPKLVPDDQNENKGEHCLQNGKGDGAISIRSSSGDGSPILKKLSIFNKMSQIDGTIAINHSNGTIGEEELYSDEDEILHIVIVPKRSHSDHEDDICNQESRVFTTPSTQTNDNLPVRENQNVCMSVSENSSPVFDEETGNTMSREQMEEINGVSPFSDVSKISGNSDWSDIDDAARRLSESQTSTYTSSKYFLKGDWSPQFVELNYQGGVRSRRRSSTRSACSLSPSACSHRTKHSITSLLDGGDTDSDRINAFMGNGRRLSDQIKDKDVNETPVKVYSLGNDLRGKSADTGNNDLQKKVNNHHHAISKQCVSTNWDHNRPNTTIETTGSDGCKLYLRRRRKPVYIHECSRDKRVDKDDITNSAEWQHTRDIENSSTYFIPRPQQKNTAGLTSHRNSTAGTFFSQMELWSPDLSDCLPVDNWSSLNNNWIGDQCEHITDHSRSNHQWREDIVLPQCPYKVHRGYIESFQERTLTPTKYREKERATSRAQSCRDQEESYITNSRFYSTYYGDQHAWPGVEDHRGLVTESCSTQGVLTFGDKFLTPTKYRRQKRRRVNSKDKPQMLISCEDESNHSNAHSKSPELDKSQKLAYKDRTKTTKAQKYGHAIPQTTYRRLDPMLGLKQPNSSEAPGVSQVPTTHTRGNRKYKYSEMRRGFRGNCSYENFLGESQDASVGQPCSTGLCLEYPQERSESIGVRTDDSKRTGIRKTKDAPEETTKGFSNTAYNCINTNSHDESSCQCCDIDAVYVTNHLGHEKNPGEAPMYYSHLCDLQQPQRPESRHHERLMHHQHQQHLKKCPSSQRSPLAIPRRHSDLRVRKLECHKLPYLDRQEGMQHKHYNLQDEQPSRWQGLQDEQREQISERKDLQEGHELHEQTSEGEDLLQEEQHAHTSAWQDLQTEQHEYKSALQGLQQHELHEQTSEEEDLQEEQHAQTSVWQDLQEGQHAHTSAWQELQVEQHSHTSAWQDLQVEQHSHTSAWQDLQVEQHSHTSAWQDLQAEQHSHTSAGQDLQVEQHSHTSAWQDVQVEQHSHTSAWQDLQAEQHSHTSAWQDLQEGQHAHTSAWQDLQEGQHAHTSAWQDLQHEQTSEGEDLLDGQYEQTSAWQEQLDASGDGDMKGIYRSGMRRQSTVETMDSGITDGSSHYSSQLSYTDTAFYSDLPGCDDQNFHMRLFLAMA